MSFISRLVRLLKLPPLEDPKTSFEGKTIIVTGANVGLGFEAALKFVNLKAKKVILAVRSIEKGNEAKQKIETASGRKGVVEVWQLDMASYDSIKAFAQRATNDLERLEIAVLNAGVWVRNFQKSQYGWELTLQVNTLSTFLLGLLLLPKLKASKTADYTPVLEIVSSGMHQIPKLDSERLASENVLATYNNSTGYRDTKQYAISKHFSQFGMLKLASLAQGADGKPEVIVTSCCPGPCQSELSRGYNTWIFKIIKSILWKFFFRTTETGSRTLVSGSTLGEESVGKFWQHDKLGPPLKQYSDQEKAELEKRISFEIIDALRKDVPEVVEHIKQK